MSRLVKLLLPGLETGSHIVVIRVLDVNDKVVAQAGPLEFITLPDVEFLFPEVEYTFQLEDKIMLAFAVSPTALSNHVCDASPPLPTGECAVPQDDRAVGLRITINGTFPTRPVSPKLESASWFGGTNCSPRCRPTPQLHKSFRMIVRIRTCPEPHLKTPGPGRCHRSKHHHVC